MSSPVKSSDGAGGRRRRVLYLVTVEDSSLFVRGQLGALAANGFDVHFATNFHSGSPHPIDQGTTSWHLPFVREPSPLRDLRALLATIRLLRKVRPDVVHAGTPKAGLLGMLAAWLCRVPVRVYALHGLRYETASGRGRRLLIALERVSCRCATHVIADSQSLRDVAIRDRLAATPKIIVLGAGSSNGVDTERFAPGGDTAKARHILGLDRFDTVIGFVGRLTRDKGIDDLVGVFQQTFSDRSSIGLLLVGSFESVDAVSFNTRQAIDEDERIVHIPWMDDTTTAYAAMDVLAFPSYREGLPNVPLEAQACGVPVVGYAATGTVDAVSSDTLVPTGRLDLLGEFLEHIVATPTERFARGQEGRLRVESRFAHHNMSAMKSAFLTDLTEN